MTTRLDSRPSNIPNRRSVFNFWPIFTVAVLTGIGLAVHLMKTDRSRPPTTPNGTIRLDVTRDTWVSSVRNEQRANLGAAPRLKTKGIQEFTLLDFDPKLLSGSTIRSATLHLRKHSGSPQRRLTLSTLAQHWIEGASATYRVQDQGASFVSPGRAVGVAWSITGGDLTSVCLGAGHTFWAFAEPTPPDPDGWQAVPVDPAVLAARVAGLSHGLVLVDDVGSEYDRDGSRFRFRLFPNRFAYSRESGRRSAPYLTVQPGPPDHDPPGPVDAVTSSCDALPPGESVVSWPTPPDVGPAGTLGFFARLAHDPATHWDAAQPVPRELIPVAREPGQLVTMHLRGLDLAPGTTLYLALRATDAAGNLGPVTTTPITTAPAPPPMPPLVPPFPVSAPNEPAASHEPAAPLPQLGRAAVCVIDPLDKITPDTGEPLPPAPPGYRARNHLWSAADRRVRLAAARNEHVAFQAYIAGPAENLTAELTFNTPPAHHDGTPNPAPHTQLYDFRDVPAGRRTLPDPLVPLAPTGRVPDRPSRDPAPPHAALLCEVYVPHNLDPGTYHGTLRLRTTDAALTLAVELRVWSFTLPDHLSFIPQMNCYSLPGPPLDLAYYRLAHEHRTCLNRLPYNWQGRVHDGYAPGGAGKDGPWDWAEFDRRFAPLLDGSAFNDLPRKAVPLDAFYLPLNENWPVPIEPQSRGLKPSYWADEALDAEYRQRFIAAARRFAEHFRERGWTDTFFEFYLNNKLFFKKPDNWPYCSAPWIFDEPVNTQDFWALRWFGLAFHEAVDPARGRVKMAFRADVSRPQWQRDLLDGVLDVNVVGGTFFQYRQRVLDRKHANGEVTYLYGSPNRIDESNVQPAAWCLDAWTSGLDGVIPWQTLGRDGSWWQPDPYAIFYPGKPIGQIGPVASARLKAFRRGQQDAEYLTILTATLDRPRWQIEQWARDALGLRSTFTQTNDQDAGSTRYDNLTPQDLWQLRTRIAAYLDQAQPPAQQRYVNLRTPSRNPQAGKQTTYLVEPP